ncbi:MAG: ParB N-terminal domain-containing protein [Magnetococcales bacterium]|nr:ParB N-terminal domain-containing protein [Magnetococcales bacterium]MBF0115299.1 ParB N-terminal domain-containing protein [Magnetococcales bacterium]
MTEITTLPISSIIVGKRHRQDLGNIAHLADSIRDLGLLQPIGVSPDSSLVFGHRRLEACRSLGWESVPVRIVDAPAIMAEHDENEVRKDFTPSERVAIGRAIEEFLGDRRRFNADGGPKADGAIQENFPESKPGQQTRDIVAGKAGFGNAKTYQQAKSVVSQGTPELVEAMDRGDVSISAAATIAKLPPTEQQAVVAGGKDAALERVRQVREAKNASVVSQANQIRREQKKAAQDERAAVAVQASQSLQPTSDRFRIIHGSCEQSLSLEAGSVDWIFTDPPYPKEFLPLFETLGRVAAHVLKPGGALLAMVGQFHLPEVIRSLEANLSYHWMLSYLTPGGQSPQIFPRRINTFWKPVLCFTKGEYSGPWIGDVVRSEPNGNDKRHHHWGQSESGMADLMRRFVKPGETVLDPFLGGGTTGVVALGLGCHFIGYDVDQIAVGTALNRLQEYGDAA